MPTTYHCPSCRLEYPTFSTLCLDCAVALREGPPPEDTVGDTRLTDQATGDGPLPYGGARSASTAGATPTAGPSTGLIDSGGPAAEPRDVLWDLSDWDPIKLALLDAALGDAGVPHSWEGDELVVPVAYEDVAEHELDRIEFPERFMTGRRDEARAGVVMSELFVASDRLSRDGSAVAPAGDVVRLASEAAELAPPFGVTPPAWDRVRALSGEVRDQLIANGDPGAIATGARTLADYLRPMV